MARVGKKETQDVIVAPETAVALAPEKIDRWGAAPQLSKRDIIIAKIMPMQPMAKKVTAGDAAFGELRDSLTNEALGDFKKPLDILPFHWNKVWVEHDWNEKEQEYQYARVVPLTPQNEELPLEVEKVLKRVYTLNVFCMLPSELARDPHAMPKIVSFRVTSLRNGRKLLTQMAQGIAAKKGPAAFVYALIVKKEQNDKGTFAVLDIEKRRESTAVEQDAAFEWFQTISKEPVKVDDSDLGESVTETVKGDSSPATETATTGTF